MIDPKLFLDKAWGFVQKQVPDSNMILNKAIEISKNENSPAAVMGMLEIYAQNKGMGHILANNLIWQSFKNKTPDQIIPHGQKVLAQSGKLDFILKMLSGETNNKP